MDPRSAMIIGLLVWSATTTGVLCLVAWRRRNVPGAAAFAVTAGGTLVWSLAAALEATTYDQTTMEFWANVQLTGIVALPVSWLVMTFQFAGRSGWITRKALALMSVVPAITLALTWTNSFHGLIRWDTHVDLSGPIPALHFVFGPWFWVHAAYTNVLLLTGIAVLAGVAMMAPSLHRKHSIFLIAGLALPAAWNVFYLSGSHLSSGLFNGFDATPICAGAGAVIVAWGLFRHGLFGIPPLAYDRVINAISEGVIVLDSRLNVVDMNPAAEEILGLDTASVTGVAATAAFQSVPELVSLFTTPDPPYRVLALQNGSETAYCAARIEPLADRSGNIVVLRDFTLRKRAEDAIRERERRYRELADSLPETVFETDIEGRLTFVNQAGLAAFGYSREEEAEGLAVLSMVVPEMRDKTRRDMEIALSGLPGESKEYVALRKDGTTFPCVVASTRIMEEGKPVGLRGVLVDLSSQKRAAEEREQLLAEVQRTSAEQRAILESIAVGLVIHDASGRIVKINPYAESHMGVSVGAELPEMPPLAPPEYTDADGTPVTPDQLPSARALRGEAVQDMILHLAVEKGASHSVSISSAPIRAGDGSVQGAVTTFTDISKLLELQQQRDDILRSISHDLRSPLTVILGHGQILRQDMEKARTRDRWKHSMDAIIMAGRQMNRMIRDLVDSLRMESGQLQLDRSEVDLPELVQGIKDRLSGAIETERIDVMVPGFLPSVEADADRLERILINLLTNALKYSDQDTQVAVSFSYSDGEVVTSVTDHGAGIPSDVLPKLFHRYGRPDEQGGRRDSLGLGLFISRALVEAHGGRIWATSEVGRGSTFSFSLSAKQDNRQQALPID